MEQKTKYQHNVNLNPVQSVVNLEQLQQSNLEEGLLCYVQSVSQFMIKRKSNSRCPLPELVN